MRNGFVLLALLTWACWGSCRSSSRCLYNAEPYVRLMNFDSTEMRAVIITTFTPGTGFKDTVLRRIYSTRPRIKTDDTNAFEPLAGIDKKTIELYYHLDAIVEMPRAGRVYYIRDVKQNQDKRWDARCTNSWSYYVNDTLHTMPSQPDEQWLGFIDLYK